ncbi:hypothetical protein STCU_04199 [Strigomonas culicis]|uniref:Uncharacterized protein n=1 Tax=Strigomonas culicis TaxID=28005 RepID=S9UMM1_9TRYP|nr:hypothetical protein STCU_04199 [Strigomonas culicis]|eukprot:EPY30173.1 hypothetical protein STCU_04199 [Strigomonas culicis]
MGLPGWMRRCEVYAICMVWPIATVVGLVGTYRIFIWSYGGRDCFRYVAIQEPFKEEWYQANPKSALGIDTPLANVPKYLDTPGYGPKDGSEHPHHNNF